jgi:hypothetical protein
VDEAEDPVLSRRVAQFRRNGEWLSRHGRPILAQHPGRYVAVSRGDVFVASDAWEARRQAREKHPDDEPFVQYIPSDAALRIYAC